MYRYLQPYPIKYVKLCIYYKICNNYLVYTHYVTICLLSKSCMLLNKVYISKRQIRIGRYSVFCAVLLPTSPTRSIIYFWIRICIPGSIVPTFFSIFSLKYTKNVYVLSRNDSDNNGLTMEKYCNRLQTLSDDCIFFSMIHFQLFVRTRQHVTLLPTLLSRDWVNHHEKLFKMENCTIWRDWVNSFLIRRFN